MNTVKKVRPILQMENMECGAACLAMILDYYGKEVSVETLRKQCGVSQNGVNAAYIAKAAAYNGLCVKAYKAEPEDLRTVRMPCIIHWNMDHFVVLCGLTKHKAVLADPATGYRKISLEEFSRYFTGVVMELTPDKTFQKGNSESRVGHVRSCLQKIAGFYALFILTELCAVVGSLAYMFNSSAYINKVLESGNEENLPYVLFVLLMGGSIVFLAAVISMHVRLRLGKKLNIHINLSFVKRLTKLPLSFFFLRNSSDLAATQRKNAAIGHKITEQIYLIILCIVRVGIYACMACFVNIKIAAVGFVAVLINIVLLISHTKKRQELTNAYLRDMGALEDTVSKTVSMIETVKSCGAEKATFSRFIWKGNAVLNDNVTLEKITAISDNVFIYLNYLGSSAVLLMGIREILSGRISVGLLVALGALVDSLLSPLEILAGLGREIEETKYLSRRLDDSMNYEKETVFAENSASGALIENGHIQVQDLGFTYNPVDKDFIKHFSIDIPCGSSLALTGKSGSGKSTLSKLLSGVLAPNSGTIFIDGHPLSDFNKYYFYSKVATVSQEVRLFDGTVFENMTMWDDTVAYADVIAAAKMADLHDEIIARKNGYDEHVAENGRNFSGGQRQKIQLVRALLKKPKILILDEATGSIDADSEAKIMENIKKSGVTLITVAHRLSTIRGCDHILVMQAGAVAESGTHDSLMAQKGLYFDLVRSVR